ncbi:hypothetical protein KHP57_00875 [Algiphilus sp. NNCM1]|uniref:hypothetical protein n=1 Tax=Algiphilus sp. TaxID=1872431 RepID=UPI001CA6D0DA|nr:hypothetical protein [Algiphilus sp.]MBY8964247.1 hypothetical protein [Algiphilus acroporae]MCI5062225.1 hypothetical protein [Algiphilus sp.]MCI5104960.1 hypothetical protein [Algiphilus sp.]
MHDKSKAVTAAIIGFGALCLSALSVAKAGEPHRPPTRGTIFIPIGKAEEADKAAAAEADAPSAIPTFAAAAPAEVAWAAIPDAAQLAQALRALVALDVDKVRRAPDMAAAVGAHLPRYRLAAAVSLYARPTSEAEAIMRLAAEELVILLTVEGDWQQLYVPALHAVGWRLRGAGTH